MSSKIIYTSEKILPYVYLCTHKENGTFYIGSRTTDKLKLPSHKDILLYRTSSKIVKPRFEEFDVVIIAEFFNSYDAYVFEQELILENFNDPLILNGNVMPPTGNLQFNSNAGKTKKSRESARNRMLSDKNPGKHQTKDSIQKCKNTILKSMSLMTADQKSLKFGSFGDKNPMYSKSYKDFMTESEIIEMKNKSKHTWINKESIWMHNFLNVNSRIDSSNINEAIEQGYFLGYAKNTHPNYTRSIFTYEILCPDGTLIVIDNLKKFLRENKIPRLSVKSGYKILSKIRN